DKAADPEKPAEPGKGAAVPAAAGDKDKDDEKPPAKKGETLELDVVASLTAFLRAQVPTQHRFDGLRLDRGYYDVEGRYCLDGMEDHAGQTDLLKELLELDGADGKWKRQLPHGWAPGRRVVLAVQPLLDGLADTLPGSARYDGLSITRAYHDAEGR